MGTRNLSNVGLAFFKTVQLKQRDAICTDVLALSFRGQCPFCGNPSAILGLSGLGGWRTLDSF